MTFTLELPPDLETRAQEEAAETGKSLPDLIVDLVRAGLTQAEIGRTKHADKRRRTGPRVMGRARGLIALAPDFFAPLPAGVEEAFWSCGSAAGRLAPLIRSRYDEEWGGRKDGDHR
jgi:hypothetical protein